MLNKWGKSRASVFMFFVVLHSVTPSKHTDLLFNLQRLKRFYAEYLMYI